MLPHDDAQVKVPILKLSTASTFSFLRHLEPVFDSCSFDQDGIFSLIHIHPTDIDYHGPSKKSLTTCNKLHQPPHSRVSSVAFSETVCLGQRVSLENKATPTNGLPVMEALSLQQFASITGSSPETAAHYLRFADGKIEEAIELFYANGGADLRPETQSSQHPPPVPPPSTRPPSHRHGHQDPNGVVNLDSDDEGEHYLNGNDVENTGQSQIRASTARRTASAVRTPAISTPPAVTNAAALDNDEAVARRLQEEFYGAASASGVRDEGLDEHGYRAPIARTTETLVGPGAFDASNADEMRAAIADQMMARRQPRGPRGMKGLV